jgi:DUF4097 and DUF4098 domain-containing protein YvlB
MTLRLTPLLVLTALACGLCANAADRPVRAQSDVTLARGSRVDVQNSNGPITITGSDAETLRVVARYEGSGNPASVSVKRAGPGGTVAIRPSYDDAGEGGEVSLDLQLPRYVSLPSVVAGSGDVTVTGMSGDLRVECSSGNVQVSNVGGVVVNAGSGDVLIEGASGAAFVDANSGNVTARGVKGDLTIKAGSGDARVESVGGSVDATLASGNLTLKSAGGNVRVAAISGDVAIDGAASVDIENASGNITLTRVTGDCDAKTASGDVLFTGEISPEHSYKFQSMSGEAIMRLCGNVPGFTVTLRSYSGEIETDFPLKVDRPDVVSRGLTGRYEDGRTQIQIEAFSGSAKILKCQPADKREKKGK